MLAEIQGLWWALVTFLTDPTVPPGSVEALVLHVAQAGLAAAVVWIAVAPPWRRQLIVVAGVALGVICFETSFAWHIVDPRNWGWAIGGGDHRWHYIAWTFFRNESWQIPPGKIAGMLYPVGSSVGNTDALPLAALLLKPFAAWLPPDYQYLGAWFLVCAVLRGLFAALALNDIGAGWFYRLLGVALIVWDPKSVPSIDHAALASASWLSLAGLWLYFRRASAWRETWGWIWLGGLSALIHPYVCVMASALCVAGIARRWWPDRRATAVHTVLRVSLLAASIVGMWWLAGYFVISSHDFSGGELGSWSMDLLSPINSMNMSHYLKTLPTGPGQYEGAHFFGMGVLTLGACAVSLLIAQRPSRSAWKALTPLLAICALLTLAALSPKVTYAGQLVVELPRVLYAPLAPFRASGRLFAPVQYAIVLVILSVVASRLRPPAAAAVLIVCLALEIRDLEGFRSRAHVTPQRQEVGWAKALHPDAWESVLASRTLVRLAGGNWSPDDAAPVVYLAARTGRASNGGVAARADFGALWRAEQAARREYEEGPLDPRTVYIVHADALDEFTRRHRVICREIEGYQACVAG